MGAHLGACALGVAAGDETGVTDSCCSDSRRTMHCRYEVSGWSPPSGEQRCETMRADLNLRSCQEVLTGPRAAIWERAVAARGGRQSVRRALASPLRSVSILAPETCATERGNGQRTQQVHRSISCTASSPCSSAPSASTCRSEE